MKVPAHAPKTLFVKPPDPFLQDEFVYQQLAPHYLQAYLTERGYSSDVLVLYVSPEQRRLGELESLTDCRMLLVMGDEICYDGEFRAQVFADYDLLAFSVMTPQAKYAGWLIRIINQQYPHIRTMIGGSHARYYLEQLRSSPEEQAFDYIVPYDGWWPLEQMLQQGLPKRGKNFVISHQQNLAEITTPPSRPLALMERYHYEISGLPAFHTVSALGCPFTCHFCEAGIEKTRFFPQQLLDRDLARIAQVHRELGREQFAVMFFDDIGLLNPRQSGELSALVRRHGFSAWRAFTHAYLICKHQDKLLEPFHSSGGHRVGIGLETGSQKSLDLINKRNGHRQLVNQHYEAVQVANRLGIAVDAFTMIYPWEDESDLQATTDLIEFVVNHPVQGEDHLGRPLKNSVDSTIMMPYQGTKFNELIRTGRIKGVSMHKQAIQQDLFYKGTDASSAWVYQQTVLPKHRYLQEQNYRNSLRPEYR